MHWPVVVQQLNTPKAGRLIAVSDIHGNLDFFLGLMQKIKLSPEDDLILLGDLLEKGENSLALLRHIMTLQKTHKIHIVCGNCDGLVLRFFQDDSWDGGFFKNYIPQHPESILRQMAKEIGFDDFSNLTGLRQALRENFPEIWGLLNSLPHILESEDYIFVHGGIPSLDGWDELEAWQVMKNDYFWEQGLSFDKYVVVGHCPVTLFYDSIPHAEPLVDKNRKIISIDGGCVLKLDGQLNALILQDGEIDWQAYDGQPVVTALEHQDSSQESVNIRWGHNLVEILQSGQEFSLCKHLESGKNIQILTKYLRQEGDQTLCQDCTDYNLPVKVGDKLSLCEVTTQGILAKKNGQTGWYWGKYAPHTNERTE